MWPDESGLRRAHGGEGGEGLARVRAMLWRRVRGAREGAAGDEGERGGALEIREKSKEKTARATGRNRKGKREKVKSARKEKQSHSEQKSRSDRATGAKVCEISK